MPRCCGDVIVETGDRGDVGDKVEGVGVEGKILILIRRRCGG